MEPYIPTIYDWMHDLEVKRYEDKSVGEHFCTCIFCNKNFIGKKFDFKCQSCEEGLTP